MDHRLQERAPNSMLLEGLFNHQSMNIDGESGPGTLLQKKTSRDIGSVVDSKTTKAIVHSHGWSSAEKTIDEFGHSSKLARGNGDNFKLSEWIRDRDFRVPVPHRAGFKK
jgi:hypothetical protein